MGRARAKAVSGSSSPESDAATHILTPDSKDAARIRVYNSVMKARVVGMALLALVGLASAADPAAEMNFSWADDSEPLATTLLLSGTKLTDLVGGSLMRECDRALSTVGLDESMEIMHLKKLGIPAPVPGKPSVTGFKLTSYRVRNPRNAPDPADLAALEHIRTKLRDSDGTASQPFLQRVERPGQPVEWRVYRAFVITPQCLLCHGRAESLQPQIRASLNRHFPEDQAVNYGPYDWRGLIRISLVVPPEKPAN